MSDAREQILQRLRSKPASPEQHKLATPETVNKAMLPSVSREELARALLAQRAQVLQCTQRSLGDRLHQLCKTEKWRKLLIGGQSPWRSPCETALGGQGELLTYIQSFETLKPALFDEVDAAITSVHACIADTGTLLLMPDRSEPRTMSLVPPVHIAIVAANCPIYHDLPSLLAHAPWQPEAMPSNIILVTGPSKTADIQQTLAYGAHGPKRLIVVLLED